MDQNLYRIKYLKGLIEAFENKIKETKEELNLEINNLGIDNLELEKKLGDISVGIGFEIKCNTPPKEIKVIVPKVVSKPNGSSDSETQ